MDQSWMKFIKSNDRISKFNTSFETVAYLGTKQNLSLYQNKVVKNIFLTQHGKYKINSNYKNGS